jgi:hypothetical protein
MRKLCETAVLVSKSSIPPQKIRSTDGPNLTRSIVSIHVPDSVPFGLTEPSSRDEDGGLRK